jgi:acetyl esterase
MSKKLDLVTMPPRVRPRAVVGFFHGGAFVTGNPKQFKKPGGILARHGIESVSFAYRTHSHDGTMVSEAIDDAENSALALKEEHKGIPVFFSGASAGGVLAVHAALRVPCAGVVLFNPVLDLSENGFHKEKAMTGDEVSVSPLHIPLDTFPPTLIFHGTADETVPFDSSARFVERLRALGIPSELVAYEGIAHRLLQLVPLRALIAQMIAFIERTAEI